MTSKYNKQDLYDVEGLVAVVTGGMLNQDMFPNHDDQQLKSFITGGSGLGLIIAKTLESNGAKVYITGRNEEKLQAAAKTAVSTRPNVEHQN
jgi:D-arabinose 1-dehydrogenase-like Zn-dependent alcohol dehydrogenase